MTVCVRGGAFSDITLILQGDILGKPTVGQLGVQMPPQLLIGCEMGGQELTLGVPLFPCL